MNSNDYKKHMTENNLIESVDSVQNIVNAMRVNQNIANLSKYKDSEVNRNVTKEMLALKDTFILLAIKEAYDREWALDMFGGVYPLQIRELYKNIQPTTAALYVPNEMQEIEELHAQRYPEAYEEWSLANVQ